MPGHTLVDAVGYDGEGDEIAEGGLRDPKMLKLVRVQGLGFGVWGLGFGGWGLRFGVQGLGFKGTLSPRTLNMISATCPSLRGFLPGRRRNRR